MADVNELIETITTHLPRSLTQQQREQLSAFIPAYFAHLSPTELQELAAEDMAGLALSHWQLAKTRAAAPVYRVFNPSFDVQGWHSLHTVVQLVTADQPWLVSSIQAMLTRQGHVIHRLIHPVLMVTRDAGGEWQAVRSPSAQPDDSLGTNTQPDTTEQPESLIHIEIDALDKHDHTVLENSVQQVFDTLELLREHSEPLQNKIRAMASDIAEPELANFLQWLDNKQQFACLGAARLDARDEFTVIHDSMGILADVHGHEDWNTACLMPEGLDMAALSQRLKQESLVVCKAGRASPVIRDEPADLVLRAHHDDQGVLQRLDCLLGIFVSGLQNEAVSTIPWMRERVQQVIKASDTRADSHSGKAVAATLRGLPREMLMQTHSQDLLHMATGIVALQERQQVKLFSSDDALGRFSNCLIYIPREAYSRDLRLRIEKILVKHTGGKSAGFDTRFSSESALARLHFIIQRKPPYDRTIDWPAIEKRIREAAISWNDKLETILRERHNEINAMQLHRRYCHAFSSAYRENYTARMAVADIDFIENHLPADAPTMSFYRHAIGNDGTVHFKLFALHRPVPLSDVMPIIENMGLKVDAEQPFEIHRHEAPTVWIHEFTVQQTHEVTDSDSDSAAQRIQSAFDHIWRGSVENDGFNRLMLAAELNWRQVVILRALCKYLLQIAVPFSQDYMIDSLTANAPVTRLLAELFEQRFMPGNTPGLNHNLSALLDRIDTLLDQVVSLDEDRILRGYRNLILAILRTNAYRRDDDGELREFIAFKFDCAAVPDLPLPRPRYEIFVYSPRVEGIHLRGGAVARGGLRWSDRREDYRTEVLGLMKAQMVKNAVIVPVGSKGGFYVKAALPAEREAMMQTVIDCYRTFLSGLLDVTDNLDGQTVIAPDQVVRHDGDDPYLVVAADKGTATFSDYANEVAISYGFWLGDAFASGGSAGYDHKKMGITARGAWESVKRHFRNLGINTQTDAFTVVGIGDMGGDVFGNGMLLSDQIRLVAAFNHQHIFIDPEPEAASGFNERKRLFDLPRSSWSDYDQALLSEGGGIYSRSAKQIELSPQAQAALGTDQQKLTPTALISVILKAPVDLLWNGGIGTYVKSSRETHTDAADRTNDGLRINGSELRVRVVGEGGNLGFTQRGRIEFASRGGLIYTDAIDNSAGVDCSDHEVNIKILANAVVANDDLTLKQRDQLLESMTDDVATHVLRDNYLQTQCIDLCSVDGSAGLSEQARFMQYLESIERLDRAIEFLPDNDEIAERLAAKRSLSRPEIAVLVSYSKMVMFDDLMASDFNNDAALESVLMDYFPPALQERYREQILSHRLRAEIIATTVTNDVVNRLGPTFLFRMQQELSASASDVASAFVIVSRVFELETLWRSIESLDNRIDAAEQYRMQILVRGLVERATHWLIRSRRTSCHIEELVSGFDTGLKALIEAIPACLSAAEKKTLEQRTEHFVNAGAPESIALATARVVPLSSSLDIVEVSQSLGQPVAGVASVYFAMGQHLELSWLREQIGSLVSSTHWHRLATAALRSDLHLQQRHLCAAIAESTDPESDAEERVINWSQNNAQATEQYRALITEMKASSSIDFAMLSLAINEVHKLLL